MHLSKFLDLYKDTIHEKPPPEKRLEEINDELSLKRRPKDIHWFPIYADQPDSYQADLMFEPWENSKGQRILQAILCVININTKYAFAEPVDYVKNVKAMEERAWNDNSSRILLNNKDSGLVLRSFVRIRENMKHEANVLNGFKEFHNKVHFDVKRLYVDEGSEFMGVFKQYCDNNNIRLTVFRASTGSKRRLGVVERFNRSLRRLIDKQEKMFGKKVLEVAIPNALDLYNRYLNHRMIQEFFESPEGENSKQRGVRYMPAMMLIPGMEQHYVNYCIRRTEETRKYYAGVYTSLQPGSMHRHYKTPGIFGKERGSTLSAPVQIVKRHDYEFATDKSTRSGIIKKRGMADSFEVRGDTKRYLPYDFVVSKNKNPVKLSKKAQEHIATGKEFLI